MKQQRQAGRGAWYADPYGSANEQRWWDGTKWTKEVREAPTGAGASSVRIAGSPRVGAARKATDQSGGGERAARFPLGITAVVGETLRLRLTSRKRPGSYELVVRDGRRVALLELNDVAGLALMECAEGSWRVAKRRRLGWDLVVEAADGRHVGWYSGRRWLPGGSISLTDGTQVDLRRSPTWQWKLQATDGQRIAKIHSRGVLSWAVTVLSLPLEISQPHVIVLTACAVVTLDQAIPTPGGPGS